VFENGKKVETEIEVKKKEPKAEVEDEKTEVAEA
jgi:hypothetical protein